MSRLPTLVRFERGNVVNDELELTIILLTELRLGIINDVSVGILLAVKFPAIDEIFGEYIVFNAVNGPVMEMFSTTLLAFNCNKVVIPSEPLVVVNPFNSNRFVREDTTSV